MMEFRAERSAIVSTLLLAIASTASAGVGIWTNTGLEVSVVGLAIDQQNPLTVIAAGKPFAGGPDAVFTMRDGGRWAEQAEASSGVRITSLAASPSDRSTLYVSAEVQGGTPSGALYVSHDTGASWSFLYLFEDSPLSTVAVDPQNPRVLYAGGSLFSAKSLSAVFWISLDSGQTWRSSRLPGEYVYSIATDRQNPNWIYVGTDGGLIVSSDLGLSWTFGGWHNGWVTAVGVSPFDPNTLYISTRVPIRGFFFGFDEVLVTKDGGHHWASTNLAMATDFAFDPSNSDLVYAGSVGVFVATAGGTNWTMVGKLLDTALAIAVDPSTETIYAAGLTGVSEYRVTPSSWTLVPNGHRTHEVPARP